MVTAKEAIKMKRCSDSLAPVEEIQVTKEISFLHAEHLEENQIHQREKT